MDDIMSMFWLLVVYHLLIIGPIYLILLFILIKITEMPIRNLTLIISAVCVINIWGDISGVLAYFDDEDGILIGFASEKPSMTYFSSLFVYGAILFFQICILKSDDGIRPLYKIIALFWRHPVHGINLRDEPEKFSVATDTKPKSNEWTKVNTQEFRKKTKDAEADRQYYDAAAEMHKAEQEKILADAKFRKAQEHAQQLKGKAGRNGSAD